MKPSKTILVFRTNVYTHMDMYRLKPILERLMQTDDKWNFDLEDCDHILRVDTGSVPAMTIIDVLENSGFRCEELEDNHAVPIRTVCSFEAGNPPLVKAMCEN